LPIADDGCFTAWFRVPFRKTLGPERTDRGLPTPNRDNPTLTARAGFEALTETRLGLPSGPQLDTRTPLLNDFIIGCLSTSSIRQVTEKFDDVGLPVFEHPVNIRSQRFKCRPAATFSNRDDRRKSEHKPRRNRSPAKRFGARCRERLENQQLVLEEEILSDHSPSAARPEALGYIGQKVDDENQYRLHGREDQRNGGAGRKIVYWPDFGEK
jgi:hypothetical protein